MSLNPLAVAMIAGMLHVTVQKALDSGEPPEAQYEAITELYNAGLSAPLPRASRTVGYEKIVVAAGSIEFTRHIFTMERENEYAPERPPTFTLISGPTEASGFERNNIV